MGVSKKTKSRPMVSSRGGERLRKVNLRFDIFSAVLVLLIVAAMVISDPHAYELGTNRPEGFATWFLLFLAYLPLEIVGLATWLLGLQDSAVVRFLVEERQTLALGLFNLAMLAVVWAVIRFYFSRRYGYNFMRAAGTFFAILVTWGAFQLGCTAAVIVWERGGFSPLHRHLRRAAEPERGIVAGGGDGAASSASSETAPMRKSP